MRAVKTVLHVFHVLYFSTLYKQKVYAREGIGRCVLFTQRFRRRGYAHLMTYAWRDSNYDRPVPIHYITPEELASLLAAPNSDHFLAIAHALAIKRTLDLEEGI